MKGIAGGWTTEEKARFLEGALVKVIEASDANRPFLGFERTADAMTWCQAVADARDALAQGRAATVEELQRATRRRRAKRIRPAKTEAAIA